GVVRTKENFGTIFRLIHEPTNVFHLELARASEFSIGLRIAHPKSVVSRVHPDEGRPIENLVRIDGTVDGVEHSGVENFYDSIYEIRLSRQFYEFQLTGDKIFLLNRRHARHGTLDYRVGAGVGLFAGYAVVVRQKQDTGEWVESSGDWKPVGFSASLNHRLVYTRPKGVLSLALGETFSTGRVRAEVMDG